MAVVAHIDPQQTHAIVKRCNELIDADDMIGAYKLAEDFLVENPDDAQVLTVVAMILKKSGRLGSSYAIANRIVQLRPDRPEAWSMLGNAAQAVWRIEEAESCYKKSVNLAKGKSRAIYLNNLASIYLDIGQFKKAEPYSRESLGLDSSDGLTRHNLGLSLLAQHKWQDGWKFYSSSIGTSSRRNIKYMPSPGEPTWDGSKGKTVVVYGEQGLGDEICAASMLQDVIEDSEKVIVDCDRRLHGLFKRSFPKAKVYGTRWEKQLGWDKEDREIDASIAGFEVGKFYRNSTESFPGTAYLTPCPDRVRMWNGLFASKGKPVIGIAWSGGTWHNAGKYRNLPISEWGPIFKAIDAHWVSLQYKDASKGIEGTPVVQYPFGTLTQDYDDTAALVASCDLVIGMQTTVCHLAGALGKPVWTIIPKTSQWRYGEEGDSIPWYKSMKIYRQGSKWPVQEIAKDLASWM